MTIWNWIEVILSECVITFLFRENKYGNGIEEQAGRTEYNLKMLEGKMLKGFKMLGITEERLGEQPQSPYDRHY